MNDILLLREEEAKEKVKEKFKKKEREDQSNEGRKMKEVMYSGCLYFVKARMYVPRCSSPPHQHQSPFRVTGNPLTCDKKATVSSTSPLLFNLRSGLEPTTERADTTLTTNPLRR